MHAYSTPPWLEGSKILHTIRFRAYALATIHRAENVDDPKVLRVLAETMMEAPLPTVRRSIRGSIFRKSIEIMELL
jgi:hypothetical protein